MGTQQIPKPFSQADPGGLSGNTTFYSLRAPHKLHLPWFSYHRARLKKASAANIVLKTV